MYHRQDSFIGLLVSTIIYLVLFISLNIYTCCKSRSRYISGNYDNTSDDALINNENVYLDN